MAAAHLAAAEPREVGNKYGEVFMKKASQFFSENDQKIVADTVAEAEKQTSGEIIPVIATKSGRYDRAEGLFGFVLALVIFSTCWYFFQGVVEKSVVNDWIQDSSPSLNLIVNLPISIGVLALSYLFGIILASRFPIFAQPFIANQEMREEVEKAAAEAFQKFSLRKTKEATGVLIYISVYERMVRVMGDHGISQKLSQSDWDNVRDSIIQGIKDNKVTDGLTKAILQSGELLSKGFPIQPGDKNELSNQLIVLD